MKFIKIKYKISKFVGLSIEGAGKAGLRLTKFFFEKIKEKEIPTHYIDAGEKYLGRDYDLHFQWSDERIYCSELVWKVYNQVLGIEIGELQRFSDFDLSHPEADRILQERFQKGIPLNEVVITPVQMFDSELLETIIEK